MTLRTDHIAGAAAIIIGIVVLAFSGDLPFGSLSFPGAGMWPKLICVLMIGLGADQFIENSSLLEYATDCLVVVEAGRATFGQMEKLLAHLDPGKVGGYVHVDA